MMLTVFLIVECEQLVPAMMAVGANDQLQLLLRTVNLSPAEAVRLQRVESTYPRRVKAAVYSW
jgi:hypothetical protein